MDFTVMNNTTVNRVTLSLLAATIGLTMGGCDKDDEKVANADLTPTQIVEQGWIYFEDGEYSQAYQEFAAALDKDNRLSDAWNGKGWAAGKLPGRLTEAPPNFAEALRLDTTRYDAIGGWAFAAYQIGGTENWRRAIDKSDSLLHRRPGWRFLHESRLDENDVRLLTAAAHFNLGEYQSSYNVIIEHLNSTFEADPNTPAGRQALLEEIERLRRVHG